MNKKMGTLISATVLSMLLLTGCGADTAVQPQPIDEAVDVCETCHMAVKNNGYAAEIVGEDGQAMKFDDIGCLTKFATTQGVSPQAKVFVQDRNTKEWIDKQEAIFIDQMDIPTPMGYGIHAFKDHESADAFLKEYGEGTMLHAEDLEKHEWKQDKSKMLGKPNHMKNGMGK